MCRGVFSPRHLIFTLRLPIRNLTPPSPTLPEGRLSDHKRGKKPIYILGFPNEEVTDGFMEALFPYYVNRREGSESTRIVSEG